MVDFRSVMNAPMPGLIDFDTTTSEFGEGLVDSDRFVDNARIV